MFFFSENSTKKKNNDIKFSLKQNYLKNVFFLISNIPDNCLILYKSLTPFKKTLITRLYHVYYRLGKLLLQTFQYWVPINIGKQVPLSYANLLRPDTQLYSPDTNTACETISYSYPSFS